MSGTDRITPGHLERLAVVYVRQSSLRQVRENRESTDRQYALAERARSFGWPQERIVTIDADLGVSGSVPGTRAGFENLKSEIAHGRVGAVLGLEVSRLARNAVDWFQLLDWCRATDTLLIEDSQVHAPACHDDTLLLGIKGTLSESELYLLRARMREGALNKAARGALFLHVPAGFVRVDDTVAKDPDLRVQHAVDLVFRRFQEHGSARQATAMLMEDGIRLPTRIAGGPLEWVEANYSRVITILKHPMMGGAYVYGRIRSQRVLDDADTVRETRRRMPREDWRVLIEDHHEGYVSWRTWLEIQDRLSANAISRAPREGPALLQGLAVCGHCGRPLHTEYNKAWNYRCNRPLDASRKSCLHLGGARIDAVVEKAFLDAISPAGVEAAHRAAAEEHRHSDDGLRSLRLEIERSRYEATLAERRYNAVDPDNRLIAATLERNWELALRALEEAQAALQRAEGQRAPPPDPARLAALGDRVERVWRSPEVAPRDRKRLLACLVEEAMLRIDREEGRIRILLRWHGGQLDEFDLPLRQRARAGAADDIGAVDLVRRLSRMYSDSDMSGVLNRRGLTTARGLPFTRDRVRRLRVGHGIAAYSPQAGDRDAPLVSVAEAARQLETTPDTVYRWIRKGVLATEQDVAGAPYRLRLTASVRRIFCETPPEGYVPARAAAKRLGLSRQRIWQLVGDGQLDACHIARGNERGLYIRLDADAAPSLLDVLEAEPVCGTGGTDRAPSDRPQDRGTPA